ncbi:MAG: aminotransferase class I/II-fold pyridoxal phosphate-dependent enzyme [Anaerolineales bacterium]|nr:aminotransferase class I/II-fold pyridoxal phosphate-dependent enzyme [Anaerolineales bacterium]MCO5243211.1 aminotransferase class I/II-fold pyridoxal phosphate-dependent enzyme [Anaerolineae bacterium]
MSTISTVEATATAAHTNGAEPGLPGANTVSTRPGPSTLSVHGGEARDKAFHSITTPIVQASTYTFRDTAALVEYMEERMFWDEPQRDEYGRYGNPTVRAVEARLAALENGDDALLTPSGMSAITGTLLVFLSAGSHLVCTIDCYRRTRDFIQTILTRYGVGATIVPAADLQAIEDAIQPNTRLIFSESPTNPFMRCLDLEGLADIGRRHGVRTAIDSTFATPLNLRPLDYGIDLVIHSVTKYLAGHNDVMAGAVIGNGGLTTALRQMHGILGSVIDPQTAYLVGRGLKTLGLRIERQNSNGLAVAHYLEAHPRVRRVWYPGLTSHPDHAIAAAQLRGFGGVVSFEIEGDGEQTGRFIDGLQIPYIGPSLGGVESLVEQVQIVSYYDADPEKLDALGVSPSLVRLACGVEDAADIIADLEQALGRVGTEGS